MSRIGWSSVVASSASSSSTDLFENDGASSPASSHAVGSYFDGVLTYTSSIDSTITNLYAAYSCDTGVSASLRGSIPIIVLMHGYAGDANSFTTQDMHRFASYGFFVVAPGLRAKNGASGSTDASAREVHDIIDALACVRTTFSGSVAPTMASIVGYSGGGGNALACACKAPDYFAATVSMFGISDYGYRTTTGWYDYGQLSLSPTSKSYLDTDVGVRTVNSDPYLARLATSAIAKSLRYGGYVELFHDASDSAVSVESSRQVVSELAAAGLDQTRYRYHESNSTSAVRWLHGHPNDNITQMTAAEWKFGRRCRESRPWGMPSHGTIRVNGWFRSREQNFDVWLGGASSPKTNGTGGRDKVADVEYDVINGTFLVTPITTTGTLHVAIRIGGVIKTAAIADPTKSAFIEFYGTTSTGYKLLLDASTYTFSNDQVVTNIVDSSGYGNDFATVNSPTFKSAGLASGPSIRFNGSNQYGLSAAPIMDGLTTFSVAVVAAFTTITGVRSAFIFGNSALGNGYALGVNYSSTSKFEIAQPSQLFDSGPAADTSPHLFIFTFDGTTWTLYIDGSSVSLATPTLAPNSPTTRAVIGAHNNSGAFPFAGDIGYLAAASGVWSSTQRDAIRTYVKSIWTGLP